MQKERRTPTSNEKENVRWAARRERNEQDTFEQMPEARSRFASAALIVNTRSRVGEPACSLARDLLEEAGVPIDADYALRDPVRLPETVWDALMKGHDLIVLGGGDGSVSSIVDLLAGRDTVLGLLPLGTANDFARTLGIPFDLREACKTVAQGSVTEADLGLSGGNYYVNVASIGLGTDVIENLSPWLKRTVGPLAYPIAAARAYAKQLPFSATFSFPDGDHEPVALDGLLQVAVGNGRFYGGGMVVAPGSGIDDGALDVYAIKAGRGWDLTRVVRGLRTGEFVGTPCVRYWQTSRVYIETEPVLPIDLDGEFVSRTPKPFSVFPNALKVLVPRSSTSARSEEVPQARELVLSR